MASLQRIMINGKACILFPLWGADCESRGVFPDRVAWRLVWPTAGLWKLDWKTLCICQKTTSTTTISYPLGDSFHFATRREANEFSVILALRTYFASGCTRGGYTVTSKNILFTHTLHKCVFGGGRKTAATL